jgi:carbonic anhydrase
MENKIKCRSSAEHYIADACVVWCFDDRFSKLLGKFTKKFKNFDLVKIAGGAKALTGDASPELDFVLSQIKTSVRLHGTKRVAIMLHRDCGAYGGSKSFENPEAEKTSHAERLASAMRFLTNEIPGVPVDIYFADFDGLYKVE